MAETKIAVTRLANDNEEIVRALHSILESIGAKEMLRGKEKVLVKPNILGDQPPERAVTTDNRLVGAVLDWLLENGVEKESIFVGESSGGMGREHTLKAFKASLIADECDSRGIHWEPFENTELVEVKIPDGRVLDHVHLSSEVAGADLVVNLPKLKTHGQMVMTCALKNMFGTMVKAVKPRMHARFPGCDEFAEALVDIYTASAHAPQLIVVDAVLAMEGNGPGRAGTPLELGLLLAGTDPLAIDVACARIMGLDPDLVYTNVEAARRGRWVGDLESVEVVGPPLEELVHPFKIPGFHKAQRWFMNHLKGPVKFFMDKFSSPMVVIDAGKCDRDAICVRSCPTHALSLPKGAQAPVWDKSKCIGCTCCMELCPVGAIDVQMAGIKGILPYAIPVLVVCVVVLVLLVRWILVLTT
ncbi:MAG: DUF362 domain-containing protein [Promethearchaeota archaeon]